MKSLRFVSCAFALFFLNLQVQANNVTPSADGDGKSISVMMVKGDKVLVQWEVQSANTYFEIERSSDGEYFETIATAEEAPREGTSIRFVDKHPELENYYRIFYITPEGEVSYSEVTFISPLPSDMTIDALKQ